MRSRSKSGSRFAINLALLGAMTLQFELMRRYAIPSSAGSPISHSSGNSDSAVEVESWCLKKLKEAKTSVVKVGSGFLSGSMIPNSPPLCSMKPALSLDSWVGTPRQMS